MNFGLKNKNKSKKVQNSMKMNANRVNHKSEKEEMRKA